VTANVASRAAELLSESADPAKAKDLAAYMKTEMPICPICKLFHYRSRSPSKLSAIRCAVVAARPPSESAKEQTAFADFANRPSQACGQELNLSTATRNTA
jgi:hypothetical protein